MTVSCTPSSGSAADPGADEAFEPQIIGFLCNWCTFTAADLAGTSRLSYPPGLRIVRVMCSGMVDPKYVIKSFLEGADGVLIGGCWPGDCHYINGNLKARRRVALLHEVLDRFGIERERLWLRWVAASEGAQFAELVQEMTDRLRILGPCRGGNGPVQRPAAE
jgi:coenzyme F420-reducing hydrogenase delta subunit